MLTGLVRTFFTTAIHQDISFRFSPIVFFTRFMVFHHIPRSSSIIFVGCSARVSAAS